MKRLLVFFFALFPLFAIAQNLGNNKIYYTSTDGNVVTPNVSAFGGVAIVSNTYENEQGCITFSGNITTIGEAAFFHCYSLNSITLPNGITSIGKLAFSSCNLSSITIPSSVTTIGVGIVEGCGNLTTITVDADNTVFDSRNNCNAVIRKADNTLVSGCKTSVILEGVNAIAESAFAYCPITNVIIPNTVTSIGESAFIGCGMMTSINIPSSVTNIGNSVFARSGLETITVDPANTAYDSRDNCNAIIDSRTNVFVAGCKNSFIPEGVTGIADGAFEGIEDLYDISIPNGVTIIGHNSFFGCSSISNITIPNSVSYISSSAFYGCGSLTTVTIPKSVINIEGNVFELCNNLADVYVSWDIPLSISNSVFRSVDLSKVTLHVPAGKVEAYKTADVWKDFGSIKEGLQTKEDPDNAGNYYATFYSNSHAYNLPEGVKAYTAQIKEDAGEAVVSLTIISGNIIPQGEAVLIHSTTSDDIPMEISNETRDNISGNQFSGTDTAVTAPENCYILSNGSEGLGFYKFTGTIPANKVYLTYSAPAGARGMRMEIADGEVTSLGELNVNADNDSNKSIYNILGQQVGNEQNGFKVVNNKAIFIK